MVGHACHHCGSDLERAHTGRPRRYCSNACRIAAWRRRAKRNPSPATTLATDQAATKAAGHDERSVTNPPEQAKPASAPLLHKVYDSGDSGDSGSSPEAPQSYPAPARARAKDDSTGPQPAWDGAGVVSLDALREAADALSLRQMIYSSDHGERYVEHVLWMIPANERAADLRYQFNGIPNDEIHRLTDLAADLAAQEGGRA